MVDISLNDLSHKAQGDFQTNLNEGLSQDEALQNTIDNITNQLVDLNLSSEFINNSSKLIFEDYKEAINSGQSPSDALNSAIEKLHQNIENQNEMDTLTESNINLDFAITGDSPRLEMMNEAIAKGLSVEDAIKYVNSKLNEGSEEFGPPTLAEFNKINDKTTQTVDAKENQEIDRIEATMDAEANKNTNDSTLTDKINIDEKNLQNESNLDHKDDDVS
tara:strand:+ start:162 stop:818 length:657 start_codon:yes stop_codon:yes gene_type:complete